MSQSFPSALLLPPGAHIHRWGLGFRQSSLHHIGRVPSSPPYSAIGQPLLSQHALVPLAFRPRVSWSPTHLLRVRPGYAGDVTTRLTAHTGREGCPLIRLLDSIL